MPAYSGALQPKKKSELQEIANALRLSDQGTKEEIQIRIKRHLDNHQSTLEDEPMFTGLFGRRKRSVQPQPPPASGRFAPPIVEVPVVDSDKRKTVVGRRIAALDPIRESTPIKDLRDVSTFLKHPISPADSSPNQSPRKESDLTPPGSLIPPATTNLIEDSPQPQDKNSSVQQIKQNEILLNGADLFIATREFLSNSRNIWSLTALCEMLYILYVIIPWKTAQLPLSLKGDVTLPLTYPPWTAFQTATFWKVILHWALPTLIIPAFVGNVISFNPVNHASRTQPEGSPPNPIAPFDPLTAAIIRLAAQIAYPFDSPAETVGLGFDVLGFRWRVLNASVGLAFAFAEAIAGAPEMFSKTFLRQQRLTIGSGETEDDVLLTPDRMALMSAEVD
ncbi:hypothetical protein K443DRAFT_671416 [Laccaria amethystina LaAM-08-1]|uniref:SAP domain-containing protein n=1 Tax=Laccaria amethystina LaAM-08-1 TaxID=1095629 RepID=A0A0C9YNI6_9AGAR|nr:hypothetical protein K443DRAFT_671416 [Laccaria amethystina LaAM-08-1]